MLAWSLAVAIVTLSVGAVAVANDSGSTPWKLVLVPAFWVVPGVLVASGRPGNPLGWLMLAVAAVFAGAAFGTEWLESGRDGGAAWATWFVDRASAFLVPATLAVLLLLPDGRLPSPRWRPVAWSALGAQVALILAWCLLEGPAAAPDSSLRQPAENPVGVLPAATGRRRLRARALAAAGCRCCSAWSRWASGIRRASDDQRPAWSACSPPRPCSRCCSSQAGTSGPAPRMFSTSSGPPCSPPH